MSKNRIKIKFGQIEFEAEGDSDLIERERNEFIKMLPTAVPIVSEVFTNIPESAAMSQLEVNTYENPKNIIDTAMDESLPVPHKIHDTLASFIKDKQFSSDTDTVLGVSYYLDFISKLGSLNKNDIIDALTTARQPKLGNVNSFINQNITKGYLLADTEKKDNLKAFKITSSGIDYIENYVPNDSTKKSKKATSRKKTQYESSFSQHSREDLQLHNYPEMTCFSKFKDKMLLAMHIFESESKGDYFSTNDLLFIMPNLFGEKASKDQINGVFKSKPHWFNKIPAEKGRGYQYKLLNGAKEYISESVLSTS